MNTNPKKSSSMSKVFTKNLLILYPVFDKQNTGRLEMTWQKNEKIRTNQTCNYSTLLLIFPQRK